MTSVKCGEKPKWCPGQGSNHYPNALFMLKLPRAASAPYPYAYPPVELVGETIP